MKILHFGDIHFGMENYGRLDPKTGLNSRFGDFCQSFQTVVDFAIGSKKREADPLNTEGPVDLVIFSGDAFKTRDPSPTYLKAFAQGIRQIAEAHIPVIMIVGNHDLPNAAGKANTLDIFPALAVPNVHVSLKPEYLRVETKAGPVQIVTLPWMYKSQIFTRDDVMGKSGEEINALFQGTLIKQFRLNLAKIDPKYPAVALGHATVEGASVGSERSVILGSDIVVPLKALIHPHVQYVALGHIHQYQQLYDDPPVVYCGSLERIDFGEEKEQKGFIVAKIKNKKTTIRFTPVPARRFQTINVHISPTDSDPTKTAVRQVEKESDKEAVVRVIIHCEDTKAAQIRESAIRETLEGVYFMAGIIKQVKSGSRVSEKKGYSDELATFGPLELLESYFKLRSVPPGRIGKLREAAKNLIEEVEQL